MSKDCLTQRELSIGGKMKTLKIAVAVALVMLTAGSAFAAGTTNSSSTGSWTFGLQGGASMPTGDYGEVASTGWNFGGMADYWINSQWGLGADIAYHANNGSDDFNAALVADPAFGPGSEAKFTTIQYGVHTTYMFSTQGTMFPYLQAGAGSYNLKSEVDGGLSPGDVSENKFGFNMGAGVDFRATPTVNLGVNGTYHYISVDPTALNWFGIEGRVTFKMPTK